VRWLGFPKKRFRDQMRSNGPFFGLLMKSSLIVFLFLRAQTTISNSIALVLTGLKELGAPETPSDKATCRLYSNEEGYVLIGKWVEDGSDYFWWAEVHKVDLFPDEKG
jgi:hypothetical protein